MIIYFYLTHRWDSYMYYQITVDMRVIAMKIYSTFLKAPGLIICWLNIISAEMQSVYSTATADRSVIEELSM